MSVYAQIHTNLHAIDNNRNFVTVLLRWVYTCNVTAYRTTVTLQVTDTIRSYKLNFHPVPHGVTVSCERYRSQFVMGAAGGGDVSRCPSTPAQAVTVPSL